MGGTFSRRGQTQAAGAGEDELEKTELPKENGTTPQSTALHSVALRNTSSSTTPMFDDTQKNWMEDGR